LQPREKKNKIRVIIPAFNEQNAIDKVIHEVPRDWVSEIIVIDNGSSDDTFGTAEKAGATALRENTKGYGMACLRGMKYLEEVANDTDVVVFLDGDHSDYPGQLPKLVIPILEDQLDFVIGSRALGQKQKGSMTPQQVYGNRLATTLMKWFFKAKYTDLGPFRAIRYSSLTNLEMQDTNYGWTIEMQIKATKKGLRVGEVAVDYRRRIGVSKVSGTIKGTIMAGYKILWTIFKYL
jgi:glycosyltransferase involved in cell wall biosynthesis